MFSFYLKKKQKKKQNSLRYFLSLTDENQIENYKTFFLSIFVFRQSKCPNS